MIKIKPCIYCDGNDVEIITTSEPCLNIVSYVWCGGCWTKGPHELTPEAAIEAWNKPHNHMRRMESELCTLASESLARTLDVARIEAEVIAMRDIVKKYV